jgi:transforming growth factor-beta-induced protein
MRRLLSLRPAGRFVAALALSVALVGCDDDDGNGIAPTLQDDIASLAAGTADLSTLTAALEAAGLVGALADGGPFTVFAPANSAFDALGAGSVAALLEEGNAEILTELLTYHVVPGVFTSADLRDGAVLPTLEGGSLRIDLGAGVAVNGASVVAADIEASNGVVHVIDGVLTEGLNSIQRAAITPDVSTLLAALEAAGLAHPLQGPGPFTVFAPVDAAFGGLGVDALLADGALLDKVLQYHVVRGDVRAADLRDGASLTTLEGTPVRVDLSGAPRINGAGIVAADIEVDNGVIHLIDGVLLEALTVVERAVVTPEVSTLTAAVGAAGLADVLSGPGPFTVFAPVNAAFDGLDLDALLDPTNPGLLQDLLTYHVIAGEVRAADLVDGAQVGTVEGNTVTIDLDGGARVNGANIVATDIEVDNGVIHLIDGVLLESLDVVQRAIVTPEVSTLTSTVVAADLAGVLAGPGPFTVFAPVNGAFAGLAPEQIERLLDPANIGLLQKVLTYHVIPGEVRAADLVDGAAVATVEGSTVSIDLDGGARVNGANIVATDIEVENGVIHLIDGVLLENLDIVDVAVLNGFDTLVGAVRAAGLEDALRSDNAGSGFTVFAPTNEAFAALPAIPSDPAVLSEILLYHVLGGEVRSTDLSDGLVAPTLQGGSFTVRLPEMGPRIEGASNEVRIVVTDVAAANGVIHVIDQVLLPPTE